VKCLAPAEKLMQPACCATRKPLAEKNNNNELKKNDKTISTEDPIGDLIRGGSAEGGRVSVVVKICETGGF